MDRLADWVVLSWGWRRRLAAFGAGAASALAQPPFFIFPVLWLTLPILVWLLDGAVPARVGFTRRYLPAFAAGWWFGFGYFLAGLWWIGAAFLVEADVFGWMMPFAVVALPAGLALFWGVGAVLARLAWSDSPARIFALAAGLGVSEWLRATLFTGFPWNAIGYALTAGEPMMQSAALFGVPALNVLAVAIFAAPAAMAPAAGARRHLVLPAFGVLAVGGLALFGLVRLANGEPGAVPDVQVRIVQPAIDQAQKWRPENRLSVMDAYLELSRSGDALSQDTLLVWPESAFPFVLTREPSVLAQIGDLLPAGATLVTGAARVDDTGEARRVFNSIYVIDDRGVIADAYDKVHLVPFGEYLPMQRLLEGLGIEQLTRLPGGFEAGRFRRSMLLPSAPPFAPLICYEIIFPGAVLPDGPRPGFLLNVTNDAWFGRTVGPWQHFHQARVRAVEEGLPLIRAANTGVSAVVDPFGRVVRRSTLGEPAVVDAPLPRAGSPTAYSAWGGWILLTILSFFVIFAGFGRRRRSSVR
ncbi:apolipoprotein N-acyltransferase [Faunimonas sp. B44]|uniref:apolipoprotein N-acyltransferase n=1 Tax=Faunimonas sp. B44 TaxID=3461493 RepID=UPI004044D857